MAAGQVALPSGLESEADLPCADTALLSPLKRSPEYKALRKRVAFPKPADTWELDGLHYFVFALRREQEEPPGVGGPAALFTMRPGVTSPEAALVVTPIEGGFAEVRNVRDPETVETVPLS